MGTARTEHLAVPARVARQTPEPKHGYAGVGGVIMNKTRATCLSLAALALSGLGVGAQPPERQYDVILRHGTVVDGTGAADDGLAVWAAGGGAGGVGRRRPPTSRLR